jgi:hypothetical protein
MSDVQPLDANKPRASHCRGCGKPIQWKLTAKGRWTPEDPDGTPHWATCIRAADFKRKKGASPRDENQAEH